MRSIPRNLHPGAIFSPEYRARPGYDPLAIMVELTHAEGLEFHAWMNPLRIQVSQDAGNTLGRQSWNTWQGDKEKAGWVVE